MGTSLKVHGLRLLVKSFAKAVHSSRPSPSATSTTSQSFLHNVLFVNRTPPPPGEWTSVIDYHIQGDADSWVGHVLGEWKKSRPGDWEVQMKLDEVGVTKGGKLKDVKGKAKGDKTSKATKGKGVKDKDANVKAKGGKSKSKAPNSGSENQPPPSEDSSKPRLMITLRKAKAAQSPLHNRTGKMRLGIKGKPGLKGKGKAPLGTPTPMKTPARQTSLATPAKPGDRPTPSFIPPANTALNLSNVFTPMRPPQKRSAPSQSPFVSGQRRIDTMFPMSPAHKRAAVSTPTTGRPFTFGARVILSPGHSTVARSPGAVSGLVKVHGAKVASGSNDKMEGVEGSGVVSASEGGMETTASNLGALASASASDAGMDTTDVDDPPAPSLINSAAASTDNLDAWTDGDLATQSSADASESEAVDQGDDDASEEEDETDDSEAEEVEEVIEETISLSQRLDLVDSEDMVMDSPDEIPETENPILPPSLRAKPLSRGSTSTQASHVSSQNSRFSSQSTQDSIFSTRASQDTPVSSQEEEPVAGSSQTICAPGSSQTVTCPSPPNDPDLSQLSQTITRSPPPSPLRLPRSESDSSQRYLGEPRPAPFGRVKTIGGGKPLFKERPLARHVSMGSGSTTRTSDQSARRPPARSTSANWSTQHAPSGARRPGTGRPILIPGKDFGVSATGERFGLTSSSAVPTTDSDSEEEVPLALGYRISITAPPPHESGSSSRQSSEKRELGLILSPNMAPRDHEPRKRNRLKADSDSDMDDKEPPRGLLFSKGKEKESDNEMNVDVDSSDDEAGLDGAVGHMSLDGPSTDPDPDVDVVGTSSGAEQAAVAASPIQTRARRKVKEAAAAVSKRGKRAPRAGTRTSSRLAAMASVS